MNGVVAVMLVAAGGAALVASVALWVAKRQHTSRRMLEVRDRRLTLALTASRAAVFEYEPASGEFVYAQDFSRVTAGFEPEELPSLEDRFDWWLDRIQTDDAEIFTTKLGELSRGERHDARLELRVRHRSGEWLYLDVYLNRSEPSEGEATIVGVLRDVTEARVSEIERRELAAQVAQSNRLEALGKLAGGVAHDFNNLLTVINGNVEFARDAASPEELDALLGEILDAGEKAGALTRQLLQFSRRKPGPRHPVEINKVVSAVDRILRRLIGASIRLVTQLDPRAGSLLGDTSQLEQVLFNLVTNSRDALPEGGTITLSTHAELRDDGGTDVVLRVRDDGTGMPPAVKNHIFDPFFSTKTRERGSGLGLSTVYGIVVENHGSIDVETAVGEGTVFTLRWPQIDESAAHEPGGEVGRLDGDETILVVEDDASVARFIRTTLQRNGYGVLEAGNGEEALAALRLTEDSVSMVVSDVVMPRMGGFELTENLREQSPELPILLVSGFAEGRPDASEDLGVRLLDKPFSRQQLLTEVRRALDHVG